MNIFAPTENITTVKMEGRGEMFMFCGTLKTFVDVQSHCTTDEMVVTDSHWMRHALRRYPSLWVMRCIVNTTPMDLHTDAMRDARGVKLASLRASPFMGERQRIRRVPFRAAANAI